jgi:hypothetical protein
MLFMSENIISSCSARKDRPLNAVVQKVHNTRGSKPLQRLHCVTHIMASPCLYKALGAEIVKSPGLESLFRTGGLCKRLGDSSQYESTSSLDLLMKPFEALGGPPL